MYFPLFLDLSQKEVLVVGAGKIARRRICALLGYAGHITVVSPHFSAEFLKDLEEMDHEWRRNPAENGSVEVSTGVSVLERCFEEADLEGKDLVLAATDNVQLNRRISGLCRQMGLLVNVCTGTEDCDFLFPSVVETCSVTIGVNASGEDHSLVKKTRKQIEMLLGVDEKESRYTKHTTLF